VFGVTARAVAIGKMSIPAVRKNVNGRASKRKAVSGLQENLFMMGADFSGWGDGT
jgi:hypothetical protein